uniref:Uncharacterized protein n=1 Tax=Noctiluca scintillans TaxID=2966 RepID=A0A7S0ZMP4_NOCSC
MSSTGGPPVDSAKSGKRDSAASNSSSSDDGYHPADYDEIWNLHTMSYHIQGEDAKKKVHTALKEAARKTEKKDRNHTTNVVDEKPPEEVATNDTQRRDPSRASLQGVQNSELQRPTGAVYVGQTLRDMAHGFGKQTWTSGATYEGAWRKDAMEGYGSLDSPDGASYKGDWRNNRQHGVGEYDAPDGSLYKGQWVNGKMHGHGQYTWLDGSTYEGDFSQGERSGHGVMKFANGASYDGAWEDSKQHGEGVYTTAEGESRPGVWQRGERTQRTAVSLDPSPVSFEMALENAHGVPRYNSARQDRCTDRCCKSGECCIS